MRSVNLKLVERHIVRPTLYVPLRCFLPLVMSRLQRRPRRSIFAKASSASVAFLRNNIHPAARINGLYYWTDDGRGRGEGTTLPEEGREVKDGKKIHSLSQRPSSAIAVIRGSPPALPRRQSRHGNRTGWSFGVGFNLGMQLIGLWHLCL